MRSARRTSSPTATSRSPASARGKCTSRRAITYHLPLRKRERIKRLRVTVNGKHVKVRRARAQGRARVAARAGQGALPDPGAYGEDDQASARSGSTGGRATCAGRRSRRRAGQRPSALSRATCAAAWLRRGSRNSSRDSASFHAPQIVVAGGRADPRPQRLAVARASSPRGGPSRRAASRSRTTPGASERGSSGPV